MATKKKDLDVTNKPTKADAIRRVISGIKQGKAFSKREIVDQLTSENVTATVPEIVSVIKGLGDAVETAEAPKAFKGNPRTAFFKRVKKIK